MELVKENGFHGTPMSLIAKRSEVAIGTIYHHFENKDALIQQLYCYVKGRVCEAILENDDEGRPYRERFLLHWVNQFRFYVQNPDYLYFLEQYINSPYAQEAERAHSEFDQRVKPLIKEGIDQGAIRCISHEILVPVIHGSIVSAAKLHLSGRNVYHDDDALLVAEVVWDGIKHQA